MLCACVALLSNTAFGAINRRSDWLAGASRRPKKRWRRWVGVHVGVTRVSVDGGRGEIEGVAFEGPAS